MKGPFGIAGGSGQAGSEGSKVAFGGDREFNKNISNRVTFCNIIMNTEISDNDPVAKVWALYWKMKTDLQQLTVDHVEGEKVESWQEIHDKALQLSSISEAMCKVG